MASLPRAIMARSNGLSFDGLPAKLKAGAPMPRRARGRVARGKRAMTATETTANVILCGGPPTPGLAPAGSEVSDAMIPLNGKPVIGWLLDDLIGKGMTSAVVVLREDDVRLRDFVERAYQRRLDVRLAPVASRSILESLAAGLARAPEAAAARVILGDTLIRDSFAKTDDTVYVGQVDDSRRWCLAILDGDRVVELLDKREGGRPAHPALAGYYHFSDGALLRRCLDESLAAGERELAAVLRRYAGARPLRARFARDWLDFGHVDRLAEARRRLLQPRSFNTLTVNPVLHTITKVSENATKLRDELDWYLALPDDLKVLAPRVVSHRRTGDRLELVQEYYGYPTLAELYVYADLHPDTWASILRRILLIHAEFRRHAGTLSAGAVRSVYVDKTRERLAALARDPWWAELLARDTIDYNGRRLRNLGALEAQWTARAAALAEDAPISVIHGDFCFSNILFDQQSQITRLIDPRGSFGEKGVHGDARYDVAKLRHSVAGQYDFITADMFEVDERAGAFTARTFAGPHAAAVAAAFDRMLEDTGYALDDIRFIEGLLFVSMVPLHADRPQRQRMMYLTGLALLNDVLEPAAR